MWNSRGYVYLTTGVSLVTTNHHFAILLPVLKRSSVSNIAVNCEPISAMLTVPDGSFNRRN